MLRSELPSRRRPLLHRTVMATLWWSPVWAPLALSVQLAVRGLEPARRERDRLSAEVPVVGERYRKSHAKVEQLEASATAWQDPVFQERARRVRSADGANTRPR